MCQEGLTERDVPVSLRCMHSPTTESDAVTIMTPKLGTLTVEIHGEYYKTDDLDTVRTDNAREVTM